MIDSPDSPDSPTADDLALALRLAVDTLRGAPADADWSRPAGTLGWSCWETVEHLADDLLAYAAQLGPALLGPARPPRDRYVPFVATRRAPGAPNNFVRADPDSGVEGLLEVLEASGGLMVAVARVTPPETRAHHPWGLADPTGFVAMSLVETLVHLHDLATGLDLPWTPPADLCERTLTRLFPDVSVTDAPWPTLLWATGRAPLPGHPRRTDWRWYAAPRE
ncbi:maleylpyruvate isomerase N-terminal domain-containing protein [Kitasatospora xanthocidica]|uniref:maleylpyruvate isomerase N-terminal domain-containing protein n=1 Tax=Kitasatospora xanthocidica TaxID=83382 RepID=UPI0036E834DE